VQRSTAGAGSFAHLRVTFANEKYLALDRKICCSAVVYSQPKIFGGTKFLILGEQQYFVYDTVSQSTK